MTLLFDLISFFFNLSTSSANQIAILFSHKLSVYEYTGNLKSFKGKIIQNFYTLEQAGMTEHGRQIDLELNYEHNLNRPTFNMCKGQFGSGGRGSKLSEYKYLFLFNSQLY